MPSEREGAILVGVCPTCSEIRLRSKILITSAEECRPENFEGVNGGPDPAGEIPLCHVCSAVLKFTRETTLQRTARPPKTEEEKVAEMQTPSTPAVVIETVFAPDGDEKLYNLEKIGHNEYLVVTTKRILRVRF